MFQPIHISAGQLQIPTLALPNLKFSLFSNLIISHHSTSIGHNQLEVTVEKRQILETTRLIINSTSSTRTPNTTIINQIEVTVEKR